MRTWFTTSCHQEFYKVEADYGEVGTKDGVHLFLRLIKNKNEQPRQDR